MRRTWMIRLVMQKSRRLVVMEMILMSEREIRMVMMRGMERMRMRTRRMRRMRRLGRVRKMRRMSQMQFHIILGMTP